MGTGFDEYLDSLDLIAMSATEHLLEALEDDCWVASAGDWVPITGMTVQHLWRAVNTARGNDMPSAIIDRLMDVLHVRESAIETGRELLAQRLGRPS